MGTRRDPRRATGARGEALAAEHLERLGFRVLARNARTRQGEIDIVARRGAVLAFVEVKTRVVRGAGADLSWAVLEGLKPAQQLRLRRAAIAWLGQAQLARPRPATVRFDAVGILLDRAGGLLRLDHIEDAW